MYHILIPGVACVVMAPVAGEPDFLQASIDEGFQIIYIIAGNGDKYVRRVFGKNAEGKDCYGQFKVTTIPGFKVGEVKEENHFLPAGKIPRSLLWEVEKFFKGVIAKFGDRELEAMIWIMWNAEQGYFLHVPTQTVAGAAVTYDWANLPAKSRIIVDIHSHANFSAFFSGTDDRDDSNTIRYSGVLGFNRRPDPMMVFRFNFMETKRPVQLDELFEVPRTEVQDTPTDWLEKVQVTSSTYSGNKQLGYQGNYGGGSHVDYSRTSHGFGGHGNYSRSPDPTKYKAMKPSNATRLGYEGNVEGWHLQKGGFVSLDDWEIEFPVLVAEQERVAAEKAAQKADAKALKEAAKGTSKNVTNGGGQQGTGPLELVVRGTEPSGPSSASQVTGQLTESKLDETNNSLLNGIESKSASDSNSLATQFPSTRFVSSPQNSAELKGPNLSPSHQSGLHQVLQTKTLQDTEFQVGVSTTNTSSRARSTQPSGSLADKDSGQQATTEPEPPGLKGSATAGTSDTTQTTGTTGDSLGVFTELLSRPVNKPVSYVADQLADGSYALRTVIVRDSKADSDAALDELQATYQQELRDAQKALQNGSMASLMEEVAKEDAKAPEGILQVEIPTVPTFLKKTPVIGISEVSPLGAGFSSVQNSAPVLQQRQAIPQLQQQVPTLIRKTPTSTVGTVVHSTGVILTREGVDDWLDRRQAQVQRDLGLMGGVEDVTPISETMVDRMHQRARQEDLLSDAEDLAELQEGMTVLFKRHTASGVINVMPDNTITLRLEDGDIPVDFDADCADYGKQNAGAKAVLDVAVKEMSNNGALMRKAVQGLFDLVEEDSKLPLFRTLVHSLPPKARESLAENGF